MNIDHFRKIKSLLEDADMSGLLAEAHSLSGFSGKKLVGALQRIARYQSAIGAGCYLEVGVFQGLTLVSVASVIGGTTAFGVDNFSQFDPDRSNHRIVNERVALNGLSNVRLINSDYEDALQDLDKHIGEQKIGTYFIDGPHDYRSQLLCLQLIKPHLSELSVILIDDCNYEHVRLANRDFLVTNPDFKLLFECYTACHPGNMGKESHQQAGNAWWNGLNVIVYDPKKNLSAMLPETRRDRALYENEHIVHSLKFAVLAPNAVEFIQAAFSFRIFGACKEFITMCIKLRRCDKRLIGRYNSMNTYSDTLPRRKFNSTLHTSS